MHSHNSQLNLTQLWINPSNSVFHFSFFFLRKAGEKESYKKKGTTQQILRMWWGVMGAKEVSVPSIRGRNTVSGAALLSLCSSVRHFLDLYWFVLRSKNLLIISVWTQQQEQQQWQRQRQQHPAYFWHTLDVSQKSTFYSLRRTVQLRGSTYSRPQASLSCRCWHGQATQICTLTHTLTRIHTRR